MKKKLKLIAAALAAITALSCASVTAFADKLKTVDGVTYRYSDSGEKIGKYTGWAKKKSGARYYYKDGVKQIGWLMLDGKGKYYIDPKDGMLTGMNTIDGELYYFGVDGKWDMKNYDIDSKTFPIDSLFDKLSEKLDKRCYGGLIYENGKYVILSVGGKAEEQVKALFPTYKNFNFRTVKYSLHTLEKVRTKLEKALAGKWYGNGINVGENKIVFDVDEKYLDEVQKYIADNGYSKYARAEKGYPITLL